MTALSRGSARKWYDEPKSGTMNGESGTMKKKENCQKGGESTNNGNNAEYRQLKSGTIKWHDGLRGG
jgi:hypothetical protein